ncbi:MAG: phospholipid carrier-dependent glycosyltransferase [Spirochaetota bacterium]|jgi:dolichyl-phosphate-mannose--protein O-mannosyl transferase|nr:phospholipid carrier-dependent glycosyltransferase [Spirochaetota bacterium]
MPFIITLMNRVRAMSDKRRYNTALIIVLLLAAMSFMTLYHWPQNLFWDENYYLTAVQKYTEGVAFFESHPPLGKLIMALGEAIFAPNTELDCHNFTETEKIDSVPKGYSFVGVRFFPVLFAVLGAALFFMIMYKLLGRAFYAFIFSSLYIFENAWILHSRGAMLDSIQFFFILGALLYFICLIEKKRPVRIFEYFILACICSLALMVKANGAFIFIFFPILFIYEYRREIRQHWLRQNRKFWLIFTKKTMAAVCGLIGVGFIVFMTHFSLGNHLPGTLKQKFSPEYRAILNKGGTGNPFNFPIMLRDYFSYMSKYHETVPKYKKYDEKENGSRAITWPLGEKSIRYRYSKKDGKTSYLYLQGNPAVWISGLVGLGFAFTLIMGRVFFKLPITNTRLFWYIVFFFGLYAAYMASMMRIDRVMYLYHYFIPLFFSLFIAALVFAYFFQKKMEEGNRVLITACWIYFAEIVVCYAFFMPLTYFFPLSTREFLQRTWLNIWELKYVQ